MLLSHIIDDLLVTLLSMSGLFMEKFFKLTDPRQIRLLHHQQAITLHTTLFDLLLAIDSQLLNCFRLFFTALGSLLRLL